MPWVRVDEEFARHPKTLRAGPLGIAMQVAALCYCNQYLTDGFVPQATVPGLLNLEGLGMRMWNNDMFGGGEDAHASFIAADLVEAGLWDEVAGGYLIHDYHHYQPSRETVLKERAIAVRRARLRANPKMRSSIKARDRDRCRYCGERVTWADHRSDKGGTYDHVVPVAAGGLDELDNIVTACRACNFRKGARTPADAGMTLLGDPSS